MNSEQKTLAPHVPKDKHLLTRIKWLSAECGAARRFHLSALIAAKRIVLSG